MQALLISHGHSVGAFTSPHFLHYNERIVINGVPASDAQIVTAFELIEDVKGIFLLPTLNLMRWQLW